MPVLIDKNQDNFIEYDATYIDPQFFGALNNPLATKIVEMLSSAPMCAIDISRKLDQPEHKIYYHLNKLNRAGIIKLVGTEKRYGMVAQLYDIVSPVIVAKLHENGKIIKEKSFGKNDLMKLFGHFIRDGKLDAKIVVGDSSPHGRFNKGSHYGNYALDLTLMIGSLVDRLEFPYLKLDTEINEIDLRGNLILIGSHFNNVIIDRVLDNIPLNLEETGITSNATSVKYGNNTGYIIKMDNPFSLGKKILIIGGVSGKGTRSSMVAITKDFNETFGNLVDKDNFVRLVEGIDKDADRVIDSIKVIE